MIDLLQSIAILLNGVAVIVLAMVLMRSNRTMARHLQTFKHLIELFEERFR